MMRVMNRHTDREFIDPDAIHITRPGRWGNRFVVGKHGDRDAVIALFEEDLWRRICAGDVALDDLASLHGKQLVCVCHPKPCHGDVLALAAAWARNQIACDEVP
jgi:hypothetical protein